jgi:hypothetical protein
MNDRGEKIVNLAREMLRAEQSAGLPELAVKTPLSFKVLCFATMLAAFGGSAVTEWINEARRPITRYEKVELDALVFYAARLKGMNEDVLRREIENRVGVSDFTDLTEHEYVIAKSYLQTEIH